MSPNRQLQRVVFLISVLVGTGWYFSHLKKATRLDELSLSNQIDTSIVNLTVKQFDAKGSLINILQTPNLVHLPKDDINILQNPRIEISQEGQPAWEISSLTAKTLDKGQRITFTQQVVVHQKPGEKTPASTLKTEEVTYYPQEKKATTNLLVTFEQAGNFIQSTGMNAYLDEKRVELLHQARGTYVPPAKG